VATALTAAGGRDALGANVVDQCLGAGLVDEILMHLVPELVGDGIRLFDASTLRASLETLDVSASGQVVNLRLRVDKASREYHPCWHPSGVWGDTDQEHRSPAFTAAHARAPRGLRNLLGSLTEHNVNEEEAA
jgi:hypothetical protein